jgi:hypothetical protein
MNKQEKLQTYQDCKTELESLTENTLVELCRYKQPFLGDSFIVERLPDDEIGKLFDVDGYLDRNKRVIISAMYHFVMGNPYFLG